MMELCWMATVLHSLHTTGHLHITIGPSYIFWLYFSYDSKKNKQKADEANKTTILTFSILVRTLIVLLVGWVHIKTNTLTVTGS